MAEITRKRRGELARGVLQILSQSKEGMPAREVLQRLEALVPPTSFESANYPNRPDVRRYETMIRFGTIALVKAGWIVKSKGSWAITEEGRRTFETFRDPEEFNRKASSVYRQWKADRPESESEEEEESPDLIGRSTTLESAEETAWSEIESFLAKMNPYDFQTLFAGLLRGMGYFVEWISPPGPDKGIDIIAHVDPLGVSGPRIKAQVKRKADKVDVDGIRAFMAVLSDSDVGIFVCTGGFTRNAEEEARRQEKRRIMLVDLERLFDLWVQHYDRIPETERRLLPLRPVHYLAPEEH